MGSSWRQNEGSKLHDPKDSHRLLLVLSSLLPLTTLASSSSSSTRLPSTMTAAPFFLMTPSLGVLLLPPLTFLPGLRLANSLGESWAGKAQYKVRTFSARQSVCISFRLVVSPMGGSNKVFTFIATHKRCHKNGFYKSLLSLFAPPVVRLLILDKSEGNLKKLRSTGVEATGSRLLRLQFQSSVIRRAGHLHTQACSHQTFVARARLQL